jgi:hypothetical protein
MLESYQNGFGLLPRLAMAKSLVRLTQAAFCNILCCVSSSSMAKLKPLLARIEAADQLIDQIVYKLYGLMEK